MMINHNLLLYSLFEDAFKVNFKGKEYTANYGEADLFELWKLLQSKKQKYPVIWLQTGYSVIHDVKGQKTKLKGMRFFFITLGSEHAFYKDRFKSTFKEVLLPLLGSFLDKIRKTNGVSFEEDNYSFVSLPFNDISELASRERDYGNKRGSQTTTTPDIWDAIVLDISLNIDNECVNVKPFKI